MNFENTHQLSFEPAMVVDTVDLFEKSESEFDQSSLAIVNQSSNYGKNIPNICSDCPTIEEVSIPNPVRQSDHLLLQEFADECALESWKKLLAFIV